MMMKRCKENTILKEYRSKHMDIASNQQALERLENR